MAGTRASTAYCVSAIVPCVDELRSTLPTPYIIPASAARWRCNQLLGVPGSEAWEGLYRILITAKRGACSARRKVKNVKGARGLKIPMLTESVREGMLLAPTAVNDDVFSIVQTYARILVMESG